MRFLQGLPNTGPAIASKLYDYFGSIEGVVNAEEKALREVEVIGKKLAGRIRAFVTGK